MGALRSLTRKIEPASVEIAKRSAARPERQLKYMHRPQKEKARASSETRA